MVNPALRSDLISGREYVRALQKPNHTVRGGSASLMMVWGESRDAMLRLVIDSFAARSTPMRSLAIHILLATGALSSEMAHTGYTHFSELTEGLQAHWYAL